MAAGEIADRRQMHDLYADHHRWLLGWMRRRLSCTHTAEDLAHDTFMGAFSARERDALAEPRAFLTVIARRLVASHYRRQTLEQAYLDALVQMPEASAPSPETHALMLEALVEVDRLLDGLSFKAKKAFLLARLEGMRYSEIATELGVSEISVKKYMAAAAQRCYFSTPDWSY